MERQKNEETQGMQEKPYHLSWITRLFYPLIGYSFELWRTPERFIGHYLYDIASEQGAVLAPTFCPPLFQFGYLPGIFVVGPHDQVALKRLCEWGQQTDPDINAREPLNILEHMLESQSMIQLTGQQGKKEHAAISKHLNNIPAVYRTTYDYFSDFSTKIQADHTYQDNIRYCVTNIIGACAFGIPEISISEMPVLEAAGYALVNYDAKDARFKAAREKLHALSSTIVEHYGDEIINANKYLSSKATDINALHEIKAGTALLVEGNLSNSLIIGLSLIMGNETIKKKLRNALSHCHFSGNLDDEGIRASYKALNESRYLQQVYMEILRFVHSAGLIPRKSSEQSQWEIKDKHHQIKHYNVPRGSYFFAATHRMAYDPHFYDNPHTFEPSRFDNLPLSALNEKACLGSFPFGLGERACPAAYIFVKLVMKLSISLVVTQTDFTLEQEMQPLDPHALYTTYEPPTKFAEIKGLCDSPHLHEVDDMRSMI